MATTTVTNRNFNATPQTFGPVTIPQKFLQDEFIKIQITSSDWAANPGRRLLVLIEQSFDSGASWRLWTLDDQIKTGSFSAKDGSLPSIILKTNDGGGVALARQCRVTVTAPDGVVNAGAVITS